MNQMLPRDRVLAALAHRDTDRVPLDFWAVPEVWEKMCRHFGTDDRNAVLDALQIDVRVCKPAYIGAPLRTLPDGSFYDTTGRHRKIVKNASSSYEEYASYPLSSCETVEEIEAFAFFPSADDYDYAGLSAAIGDTHKTHYIKVETGGIFETAWGMRGMEQFLVDMLDEPEIAHAILRRYTDFFCGYVKGILDAAGDKIDMVYTYDDIAGQSGLLMSTAMWEEFIKPCHERLNSLIKSYGKTIMYHSCGAVYSVIDRLAALPIDVLNPLQPCAAGMDFQKIKDNYGDRLCFHGGIDIQNLLPRGSVIEVRAAVRRAVSILAKNGGYILTAAHHIQADTPIENILAMYDEACRYCK